MKSDMDGTNVYVLDADKSFLISRLYIVPLPTHFVVQK